MRPGTWPPWRIQTLSQAARFATQQCGLIETVCTCTPSIIHHLPAGIVGQAPPEISPGDLICSTQRPGACQGGPGQEPYSS